jgi:hypothetical protein
VKVENPISASSETIKSRSGVRMYPTPIRCNKSDVSDPPLEGMASSAVWRSIYDLLGARSEDVEANACIGLSWHVGGQRICNWIWSRCG